MLHWSSLGVGSGTCFFRGLSGKVQVGPCPSDGGWSGPSLHPPIRTAGRPIDSQDCMRCGGREFGCLACFLPREGKKLLKLIVKVLFISNFQREKKAFLHKKCCGPFKMFVKLQLHMEWCFKGLQSLLNSVLLSHYSWRIMAKIISSISR